MTGPGKSCTQGNEATVLPNGLYIDVSGLADGPVVVLVNSLATSMGMWDAQLAALQRSFRVVRYDHPGHGASAVLTGPYSLPELGADLLSILDLLQIPSASICGLSLGGMVAMWVAAHAPARVDNLVLCCTTASFPAGRWEERMAQVRRAGTSAVAESMLSRWFTPQFHEEEPEQIARFTEMIETTADEGYLGCCAAMEGMDLRRILRQIAAPTLIIAGSHDVSSTPSTAEETAASIRAGGAPASVTVIEGAAHLANVEKPAIFTRAVINHLKNWTEARV